MKFLIILCIALLPFSFSLKTGRFHPYSGKIRQHRHNILKTSSLNSPKALSSMQSDEELDNTQEEFDYHIYVREILPFGNDTDEKIQKKIIQELNDVPSNFKNLRKLIKLTPEVFPYLKTTRTKINSDVESVIIFRNVTASHWYDDEYDQKTFSTLVRCDSSTKSEIRIKLPTNVHIVANLSIIKPNTGSVDQGSIKLIFRNGTITKQITSIDDVEFEDPHAELSFANSKIDIQSNSVLQILSDTNLQDFYKEAESSLRHFFSSQLNEEIAKRDANLTASCSQIKFIDRSQSSKHDSSSSSLLVHNINLFNNLYVISTNTRTETWKGIVMDAGPIIMSGFSNYNTSELFVSREYDYNERRYVNKLSSRMKIANLNGQFESRFYHNNLSTNSSMVFFFVIDYVQFDNNYEFVDTWGATWNQDIQVYVGRTQITRKGSKSQSNAYEVKFTNSLLSEYLKSVITESLRTSLKEKLRDTDFSFVETFFKDD